MNAAKLASVARGRRLDTYQAGDLDTTSTAIAIGIFGLITFVAVFAAVAYVLYIFYRAEVRR